MTHMLTAGNISFTYDLAGNQTTKTVHPAGSGEPVTTTMTWAFRNKMIRYQSGEVDVRYRYDGDGLRVRKGVVNGEMTNYIFDRNLGLSQLLFEADGTGSATAAYQREANGLLVSQTRGTTTSCYSFDALGTTRTLTSPAQSVTDAYVFDAWGNELESEGNSVNPFGYVGILGYWSERDLSQTFVGQRWYSPQTGKWHSAESPTFRLRDWTLANPYNYGRANPTNFLDPDGKLAIRIPPSLWAPGVDWLFYYRLYQFLSGLGCLAAGAYSFKLVANCVRECDRVGDLISEACRSGEVGDDYYYCTHPEPCFLQCIGITEPFFCRCGSLLSSWIITNRYIRVDH